MPDEQLQNRHAAASEAEDETVQLGGGNPGAGNPATGRAAEATLPEQYEILEEIGKGGMGVVYKARNKYTERVVAVKVLKELQFTSKELDRFLREAKVSSAFTHSNAVSVIDFGVCDTKPYLVMELIEGLGLEKYLAKHHTLTVNQAITMAVQISNLLKSAHANNVVHRDLKPSNIMVTNDSDDRVDIKVLDFGLAKMVDVEATQHLTQTGEVVGTPLYMSPEQFMGEKIDARADIYSLGAVLYQCCAGRPPHKGDSPYATMYKRFNEKPAAFAKTVKGRERDLERIILRCLEVDRDNRYQSADELLADLKAVQTGGRLRIPKKTLKGIAIGCSFVAVAASVGFVTMKVIQGNRATMRATDATPVLSSTDPYATARRTGILELRGTDPIPTPAQFADLHLSTLVIDAPRTQNLSFVRDVPQLRRLGVRNFPNGINRQSWQAFASLKELEVLDLRNGKIRPQDLQTLSTMPYLHVFGAELIAFPKESIDQISKCATLHSLSLPSCRFAAGTDLSSLSRLHLDILNLSYSVQVDDRVVAKMLPDMLSLKVLWLRDTSIGDASCGTIAKLTNLRSLNIGGTRVTDLGLQLLAPLHELRQLDLFHLAVTDKGIESVAHNFPQLKHLYLQGLGLTGAAVRSLLDCKQLQVIDAIQCGLNRQELAKLTSIPSMRRIYVEPGALGRRDSLNALTDIDDSGRGLTEIPVVDK